MTLYAISFWNGRAHRHLTNVPVHTDRQLVLTNFQKYLRKYQIQGGGARSGAYKLVKLETVNETAVVNPRAK